MMNLETAAEDDQREAACRAKLPPALSARTLFLLSRLALESRRLLCAGLATEALRPYHVGAMALLDRLGSAAQTTIADALHVDPSNAVTIVDDLEKRGLVIRGQDPLDRRRHAVALTARGRKTLTRCLAIADRVEEELLAPLDAESRSALHAILSRLAAETFDIDVATDETPPTHRPGSAPAENPDLQTVRRGTH